MPTTQQHIIRRHFLHVELSGSESDGLALQRRLSELCRLALPPALEAVFDHAVPPHVHLRIDRLDVDAGTVDLATLEADLLAAVSEAVDKQLRGQIAPRLLLDGSKSTDASRQTEQQSVEAAWVFFLHTGTLPWWFCLPAGQSLEQAIADSWQGATPPNASPRSFQADLLVALGSTAVRQRLLTQYSPDFLERLLARLSVPGLQAIRAASAGLASAVMAPRGRQRFVRQLWQTAFAGLAAGEVGAAAALVASSWQALTAGERQEPGLSEWLARHWPQAIDPAATDAGGDVLPAGRLLSDATSRAAPSTSEPAPAFAAASTQWSATPEQTRSPEPPGSGQAMSVERRRPSAASPVSALPGQAAYPSAGEAERAQPAVGLASAPSLAPSSRAIVGTDGVAEKVADKAAELPPEHAAEQVVDDARQAHRRREADDRRRTPSTAAAQAAAGESGRAPCSAPRRSDRIDLTEGVYVDCAGVILLHPFLVRFFETLAIAEEGRLLQPERALCLLHFLATGQRVAPEYALTLAKLLCNVPFATPVKADVGLTVAEIAEAEALLVAVIGHWDALRNTSPDGLRGSFLVRPGKMSQGGDGDFLLQVEGQSCDILLDRLPWGLGVVKLPWMERMLWVEWAH
ncbi:MAG: hypothetical protein DVS81_11105 [Candidatus Accumulibacter meliphilus]|uniref:Uncharacterized protein n=1 Tax=Candidatus Accumulibacter meliphilus TaxID=2211374 RepID=A0A369XQI5_9PROT|nr:MAG: hypothetical protein DVS81_11105 [Candidatus Accumulibacter meliphilus]